MEKYARGQECVRTKVLKEIMWLDPRLTNIVLTKVQAGCARVHAEIPAQRIPSQEFPEQGEEAIMC